MKLIDVHTHTLPDYYVAAMHCSGVFDVEGFPLPTWTVDEHLKMMDRHYIPAGIVSISATGLYFISGPAARTPARRVNE